jgi:hypothetical protein
MRMLLDAGAEPNARDAKGWTPLRHALRKYSEKHAAKAEPVVRMLLDAGADASIGDNEGRTPAQSAATRGPLGALGMLLGDRPQDVAAEDAKARSARKKIEARGAHGKSISERAQMTGSADASADAPIKNTVKPKSKSL